MNPIYVKCKKLSVKFASLNKTFHYKNTSPNILINWRLHVTNYFTTICQDMSFLACTCIIIVIEKSISTEYENKRKESSWLQQEFKVFQSLSVCQSFVLGSKSIQSLLQMNVASQVYIS